MKLTPRDRWLIEQGWLYGEDNSDTGVYFGEWLKENESRLAAEAPSDWISVDDRLPETHTDGKAYLVHSEHIILEPMCKIASFVNGDFVFVDWDRWTVTHWKPLPAPPEKDK